MTSQNHRSISDVIDRVASETATQDLVVALYLLPGVYHSRGSAYVRQWFHPTDFTTGQGRWSFTKSWVVPTDLPDRYKLIRMRLDDSPRHFPKTERDTYEWEFKYPSFEDHLATLFAHELHHYRRFHLNLHPGEGEQSANRWALKHVQNLGFPVEGKRLPVRRKKKRTVSFLNKKLTALDPFIEFRTIKPDSSCFIKNDPRGKYMGERVRVIRPLRSNAKRLVIETHDGKVWRWPVTWLELPKS